MNKTEQNTAFSTCSLTLGNLTYLYEYLVIPVIHFEKTFDLLKRGDKL